MADLLECLIQIKALGEALTERGLRSERAPTDRDCAAAWERLADAERRYADALEAVLADDRRSDTPPDASEAARAMFARLRRANLTVLERCTASQLAGLVDWPGRPTTTVADLVAIMLANDIDLLGELRQRHSA